MDVPLYVMPGQVDLIADERALVEEFRYQLDAVVPAVVVLDTLNRSLSGSESSDKDMTLYALPDYRIAELMSSPGSAK